MNGYARLAPHLRRAGPPRGVPEAYIALLEEGSLTVRELSRSLGVDLSVGYRRVRGLLTGGLARCRGRPLRLFPTDPHRVLDRLLRSSRERRDRLSLLLRSESGSSGVPLLAPNGGDRVPLRVLRGGVALRHATERALDSARESIFGVGSDPRGWGFDPSTSLLRARRRGVQVAGVPEGQGEGAGSWNRSAPAAWLIDRREVLLVLPGAGPRSAPSALWTCSPELLRHFLRGLDSPKGLRWEGRASRSDGRRG